MTISAPTLWTVHWYATIPDLLCILAVPVFLKISWWRINNSPESGTWVRSQSCHDEFCTVHWLGACANDHALISCTINEQLLSYQDPWARYPGGQTGAIKAKEIDLKQIPRIQSKLDAIMRPFAQQIITDINEGTCIEEMGLWYVVESRVATAGMLMHKNSLGMMWQMFINNQNARKPPVTIGT